MRRVSEAVASVPIWLGYVPREQVVAVPVPAPGSPTDMSLVLADVGAVRDVQVASYMARVVAQGDRIGAWVVVFTQDDPRGGADATVRDGVARLREALTRAGLRVLGVGVATPSGYLDLDCRDPQCCPPGGRALAELDATRVRRWAREADVRVAASRADLVDLPPVAASRRARARAAARAHEAAGLQASAGQWREVGMDAFVDASHEWRRTRLVRPQTAGTLAAGLGDRQVRDAVLVQLVLGPRGVDAGTGPGIDLVDEALSSLLDRDAPHAMVEAYRLMLAQVAALVPERAQPALTLMALLSWWSGDDAVAAALLAEADDRGGRTTLGSLLGTVVGARGPAWTARS
jgi:hypothetical protein